MLMSYLECPVSTFPQQNVMTTCLKDKEAQEPKLGAVSFPSLLSDEYDGIFSLRSMEI